MKTITVRELKIRLLNPLKKLSDEDEVTFGGGQLSLFRPRIFVSMNGKKSMDIEFNEVYEVTVDPDKL